VALDAEQIVKTARKLRKLLRKAPKRPAPEQVHSLRTNIRRLETAFDALGCDPSRGDRRMLRDLGRVRRRAGKIRDMDVFTADLVSLHVPREEDCAVELVQLLGFQRYQHAKRLHTAMQRDGKVLGRRVKRATARLKKRIFKLSQDSRDSRYWPPAEAAATAIQLSGELKSPSTLNRNNLHPYRLKVKKLRDVLQLAEKPAEQDFIDTLGEVKDAIGDWHDWQELAAIAADLLDHGAACKLLSKLNDITREKYDHALSLTVKMRNRYLRSHNHRLSGPVLIASSAVAS
jgi:CHAD domain-containing protein